MKSKGHALAMRVSTVGIVVNVVLSIFKAVAGIVAHSSAMVSDAIHSASDVFSTFIVMIGVSMSEKGSDHDHQYGHEKLECIAGILLACILFATGIGIGYSGIMKLLNGNWDKLPIPGMLALIAACVSIVTKEWMYWYTRGAAKKLQSTALMANAWHHRSDALSSIGSLAGIVGARLGFLAADPIASLIICFFILKAAVDIFKDAASKMDDHAMSTEECHEVKKCIEAQKGVLHLDSLKTRLAGNKAYVDVEIGVNPTLSVIQGHNIAEEVHHAIEFQFPEVKHCMVHVNPFMQSPNS